MKEVTNDRFLCLFTACQIANNNYIFDENILFEFINNCKVKKKHLTTVKNIENEELKNTIEKFINNNILYSSDDNLISIPIDLKIETLINSDFTFWDNIAEFTYDYDLYTKIKLSKIEKRLIKK